MPEFYFHSISWEQIDGLRPKFAYGLVVTSSRLRLLRENSCKFITVMALEWCQDFVSTQYFENKFMEFGQVLHMHWYWQHLGCDFDKFITELWPLIGVRILFPLNILGTNWWNLTKFCVCIAIDKVLVGINFTHQFSLIYNRDWCQNFVSAQYLDNKLMVFYQILQMHLYWLHLGWD